MTQPDAFVNSDPSHPTKRFDLWIAGAIVLAVVFLPALVAGIVTLFVN